MQINHINNNINFQKKLKARTVIGPVYNPQPVKIYHLDERKDYFELRDKLSSGEWKNSIYGGDMLHYFKKDYNNDKYLAMEDEDGNLVALADIIEDFFGECRVNYLETAPKYAKYQRQNRDYKYAGETMLAYITSLAKQTNKDRVALEYRNTKSTEDFYFQQCGFDDESYYNDEGSKVCCASLKSDNYDKLINSNEEHTGCKIDFVG